MIKIKVWPAEVWPAEVRPAEAGNERNSPAIAQFSNADVDYFGLKLVVHVLISGSLR
ncbi:MAG: hypothetical protein KTR32_01905 [Granulosicoccus sp.]|nr:hypothetical protein [Granulosicoccus sp.]